MHPKDLCFSERLLAAATSFQQKGFCVHYNLTRFYFIQLRYLHTYFGNLKKLKLILAPQQSRFKSERLQPEHHLSPVFLLKYCLLMTLLPNFIVNFLGIFLIGSIQRVLVSLLTKLLTDSIFVNGPVFKCPFTKTVSVNNFINKLTNTL